QMTLNDFIRRYVAPNFVLDEEHNVMMGVFIQGPEDCISDERLLRRIRNLPEYQFLFDARRLMELDVGNLQRWGDFEHKEIVFPITRTKLNNALAAAEANERARQEAAVTVAPVPVEGVYNSVFNAKWGYVESGHAAEPLGMRVVEANATEPEKMWSESEVNVIPRPEEIDVIEEDEEEEDEGEASGARLEFLVLTSEKGWPYKKFDVTFKDVFVRKEVLRVWNVLKEDIDGWPTAAGARLGRRAYAVVGTPGIGKSLAVGSFVLHKLLQYDPAKIAVVAYFVEGSMYLFRKTGEQAGTVVEYKTPLHGMLAIQALDERQVAGYYIFDVTKERRPSDALPCKHWGGIVLTSPAGINYEDWMKQREADHIFVNCYTAREMKAFYAWQAHNSPRDPQLSEEVRKRELEKGWKNLLKRRIYEVGPLPRFVFREKAYEGRRSAIIKMENAVTERESEHYIKVLLHTADWYEDGSTHKLVKLVRVLEEKSTIAPASAVSPVALTMVQGRAVREEAESSRNRPVSPWIERRLLELVTGKNLLSSTLGQVLGTKAEVSAWELERFGCFAFMSEDVADTIIGKMKYLPRTVGDERPSVLADKNTVGRVPSERCIFDHRKGTDNIPGAVARMLQVGVLYKPLSNYFPVLDAFYLVERKRAAAAKKKSGQASDTPTGDQSSAERVITFIGLQVTRQDTHNTTASKMASFMEYMTLNFNNWEVLKRTMEWEFIYIQHADSTPMTRRQRGTDQGKSTSDPQAPENLSEPRVEQYQVQLDAEIAAQLFAAFKRNNVGVGCGGGVGRAVSRPP
ncbi:retrotransposon hot spot (RHS) protein, partial [Trypanosoma conorhini]